MKSGKCPKCNSTEIFASYGKSTLDSGFSTGDGQPLLRLRTAKSTLDSGFSTGDGQPLLRLRTAKSGLFGDDYKMLEMETYVCRACGCVEQYVHDLAALRRIDSCANWRKAG